MTKGIWTDGKLVIPRHMSKDSLKSIESYIQREDIKLGEFFAKDKWPSRRGKFKPGDIVKVELTCSSAGNRFNSWAGKTGTIVGWRRTSTTSDQNQSEYRVYDPETEKSRWIWADQLVKTG